MRSWLLALALTLPLASAQESPSAPSGIYKSVVRIEVASQIPDYATPWNSGRFSGGIGSGFIIGKNKILTNAHVISNSRRILLNYLRQPEEVCGQGGIRRSRLRSGAAIGGGLLRFREAARVLTR
ncbi:MAG: hypothetical protein QM755_16820 [Luteolibacter sp.]